MVQSEFGALNVGVMIEMIDTIGIKEGGAAFNPVYFVTLLEEELG